MTVVRRTRTALVTLPLLLGLAATGCSSDGGGPTSAGPHATTTSSSTTLSATDADFLRAMQGLGRQGLRMSNLAREAGSNPDLLDMAHRMASSQHRDLASLSAVRDEMGSGSMSMMRGSMGDARHRGMMGSRHLGQLSRMHGKKFDARFLEMMSAQSRGMMGAARRELAHGTDLATRRLAAVMAMRGRGQLKQMASMMGRR